MAKQRDISEIYDISSSEDELDLDVYTDKLEKVNIKVEENNSNDNDILPPRKRANVTQRNSDKNITNSDKVEDNVPSSEEWGGIIEENDPPARINFSVHPQTIGPQIPSNIREPIDYFTLYFTNELLDSIIKETNHYANEKIKNKQLSHKSIWHNWYDIDRQEFLAFIAVILNMGIIKIPNLQKYWSTASNRKIPFFLETFNRERFMQIFWMLHLKTPALCDGTIRTRIQKANNYLEYINSKFSQYFIPDQAICVEESVIKFKGRISFITNSPNKSTKWGIRIYALADSKTGYLFSILPYYYGSITSKNILRPDLLISSRIPLHLYKKLLEKVPNAAGYHMFTDRYYISIILAKELLKMKCYLTGTIKVNRKEILTQIPKLKFLTEETVAYKKNNTLFAWKDKKILAMLNTWNHPEMKSTTKKLCGGNISVNKSEMILNYTANMSDVYPAYQHPSAYCFLQKSLKWWKKLFFWGLEMCIINSYILYRASEEKNNEKPMTRLKFVKLLIDQLRGDFRESRMRPSTSFLDNTLDNKLHVINVRKRKRDCIVCSNKKKPGGKTNKSSNINCQTNYYCTTCIYGPAMHIGNCFTHYHMLKKYKI